ncbi:MAG TPA: hypothetical protein VKX45_08445 [Bryobacteraceae bacterium]|nr:hypothetical protein [Bryobacteraceae bacterium]
MDALAGEDVDLAGERRRHRRHENSEASIGQFLDDERGDQRLLDFGQSRLPRLILCLPGQALRKTANELVSRDSPHQRILDLPPDGPPDRSPDRKSNEETEDEDGQHGENAFRRQPFGEDPRQRMHHRSERFRHFE